jgi:hypothetical protein
MKSRAFVFNGFLWVVLLALLTGCGTPEERKRRGELSTMRIHVETDSVADQSAAVSIIRSAPITINIERDPLLDENNVVAALLVDEAGSYSVEVQFDRQGSWLLERATVIGRGRHLAIFAQFGDNRWLGAPLIKGKNSSGRLRFTPDATREEADRFVRGLNNTVRKIQHKENWPFPTPIGR